MTSEYDEGFQLGLEIRRKAGNLNDIRFISALVNTFQNPNTPNALPVNLETGSDYGQLLRFLRGIKEDSTQFFKGVNDGTGALESAKIGDDIDDDEFNAKPTIVVDDDDIYKIVSDATASSSSSSSETPIHTPAFIKRYNDWSRDSPSPALDNYAKHYNGLVAKFSVVDEESAETRRILSEYLTNLHLHTTYHNEERYSKIREQLVAIYPLIDSVVQDATSGQIFHLSESRLLKPGISPEDREYALDAIKDLAITLVLHVRDIHKIRITLDSFALENVDLVQYLCIIAPSVNCIELYHTEAIFNTTGVQKFTEELAIGVRMSNKIDTLVLSIQGSVNRANFFVTTSEDQSIIPAFDETAVLHANLFVEQTFIDRRRLPSIKHLKIINDMEMPGFYERLFANSQGWELLTFFTNNDFNGIISTNPLAVSALQQVEHLNVRLGGLSETTYEWFQNNLKLTNAVITTTFVSTTEYGLFKPILQVLLDLFVTRVQVLVFASLVPDDDNGGAYPNLLLHIDDYSTIRRLQIFSRGGQSMYTNLSQIVAKRLPNTITTSHSLLTYLFNALDTSKYDRSATASRSYAPYRPAFVGTSIRASRESFFAR